MNDVATNSFKCIKSLAVATAMAAMAVVDASGADSYDRELQYLESTGTQWLDSGVVPTSNTMTQITYQYVSYANAGSYDMICGLQSPNRYYPVSLQSNNILKERYVYNDTVINKSFSSAVRHEVVFNDKYHRVFLDGACIATYNQTFATATQHIYIFGASTSTGACNYRSAARIWKLDIFESGRKIRAFIPVKDVNGVACFFDKIEKKLYYNQGTGNFTAGPDADSYDHEVAYLQSSGGQWIDTGLKAASNTTTRVGYLYTGVDKEKLGMAGGARSSTDAATRYYPVSLNGGINKERYVLAGQQGATTYSTAAQREVLFNDLGRRVFVDGVLNYTFTATFADASRNMFIFAANSEGGANWMAPMRIWHYDIWEKGVQQRQFVPVVDGDGVACLYDRIEKKLYYNQGTGAFTAGPDISHPADIATSVTLDADTDWTSHGALTLDDGTVIDLNGHSLQVVSLDARSFAGVTVTDTSAGGGGELHYVIPANVAFENTRVRFSGKMKLVKDGAGTFIAACPDQDYVGGNEVTAGVLRIATGNYRTPSEYKEDYLGQQPDTVKVSGGKFDLNGNSTGTGRIYELAGGELTNSRAIDNGHHTVAASTDGVTLLADSTISGQSFGFIAPNYAPISVRLNGHKLSLDMNALQSVWIANTTFEDEGEIEVLHGYFIPFHNECVASNVTLRLPNTEMGAIRMSAPMTVCNFLCRPQFQGDVGGSEVLTVLGRYTAGMHFPNIALVDGSTLDLGECEDVVWSDTCSTGALTYPLAGVVTVGLGERTDIRSGPNIKLVSWDSIPSCGFCLEPAFARDYKLVSVADGLYFMRKLGLTIVIR